MSGKLCVVRGVEYTSSEHKVDPPEDSERRVCRPCLGVGDSLAGAVAWALGIAPRQLEVVGRVPVAGMRLHHVNVEHGWGHGGGQVDQKRVRAEHLAVCNDVAGKHVHVVADSVQQVEAAVAGGDYDVVRIKGGEALQTVQGSAGTDVGEGACQQGSGEVID